MKIKRLDYNEDENVYLSLVLVDKGGNLFGSPKSLVVVGFELVKSRITLK